VRRSLDPTSIFNFLVDYLIYETSSKFVEIASNKVSTSSYGWSDLHYHESAGPIPRGERLVRVQSASEAH
jgi:hypothetical protein